MSTVLAIPGAVQLDGYSCGFITARLILKGFDVPYDRDLLKQHLQLTREGLSLDQLRVGLKAYGITFRKILANIESIRRQIDRGCPVLLGSKPGRGHDHWSLIVGYDGDEVVVRNHRYFRRWFHMDDILNDIRNSEDQIDSGCFAVGCVDTH